MADPLQSATATAFPRRQRARLLHRIGVRFKRFLFGFGCFFDSSVSTNAESSGCWGQIYEREFTGFPQRESPARKRRQGSKEKRYKQVNENRQKYRHKIVRVWIRDPEGFRGCPAGRT